MGCSEFFSYCDSYSWIIYLFLTTSPLNDTWCLCICFLSRFFSDLHKGYGNRVKVLVLENKVMSSRSFSETGLDQDPVKTVERGEEVHPTGSTARVVIKHQWKCVIRRNCILWLRFMRVQDHHSTLSPKTNSRWLLYHNRLILLQWDTIHHFISTSERPSQVFKKWHFN